MAFIIREGLDNTKYNIGHICFLRNYHYISYHGLAGKRIGVIAFLVITVFGINYTNY